jgi:hypothetical protein
MTLEIRGVSAGLLDEPFDLQVRGAAPGEELLWRARYRDDDVRVWRAAAARAIDLSAKWKPAKPSTGPQAALGSLRPVRIDVRVEAPDGRAAARTLTREILGEGVKVRRWRDLSATLHIPDDGPCSTLIVDGEAHPTAAPLLASRGALVLVAASPEGMEEARERLAAVPGAAEPVTIAAAEVPLPPNVGATDRRPDAAAWDALLARLAARPRGASDSGH